DELGLINSFDTSIENMLRYERVSLDIFYRVFRNKKLRKHYSIPEKTRKFSEQYASLIHLQAKQLMTTSKALYLNCTREAMRKGFISGSPELQALEDYSLNVGRFVIFDVLSYEDYAERMAALRYWVTVLKECLHFQEGSITICDLLSSRGIYYG